MSDLFKQVTIPETPADDGKQHLADLVGEDKKFKTTEELAKGKAESDAYILQVQKENEELRAELQKRATLEEFMTKMKEENVSTPETPSTEIVQPTTSEAISPEDLEKLLNQKLTERETENLGTQNLATSIRKAQEVWGDQAQVEINRKAKELGVSVSDLEQYAKTKPDVFFKLTGLDSSSEGTHLPQTSSFSQASVDTVKMPSGTQKKNYAYYENMRKADSQKYFSPEVQNEMFKLAQENEEAFYA